MQNRITTDQPSSVSGHCSKPHVVGCAYDVVKKLGKKYKPLQGVYYLVDEDYHESEDYNCNDYCFKCATKEAQKAVLYVQEESSPEKEDFCICDGCGKIIETSIIWTEQEMEHWLDNLEKEDLKRKTICYELMKVLEPNYGAFEKFPKHVEQIANRVLSLA